MDKNEPSRFLGEGVSFKAKLIGILEVSEARGDRMCQEALADLKMAIRAAGEHKQRITINIAIDGLRLRDEKTGDSLYHHPVHKISFIAQDMSDSRAFGYIFGSPDTGHRFFGIKTDKAASQVVIAMRDLFQVVFELKKKEIELAKQHIEQKSKFTTTASLFTDSAISTTKSYTNGDSHNTSSKLTSVSESAAKTQSSSDGATARPATTSESAIADLVDLELELSSIQQGIHQMERITPSDPFGPNKDDPFGSDPFGDSFTSFPQKPFLPPPPSARDRPRNTSASDTSSSLFSPKTPKTSNSVEAAAQDLFKNSHDDQSCGWFTPTGGTDSLFEDAVSSTAVPIPETATSTKEAETTPAKESNASILSQFDVFTELDPLGTGRSKPYIDKKLFFQELKNPPKKVLKDLVTETQPTEGNLFNANFETNTHTTSTTFTNNLSTSNALFQTDPFADGDPFDKTDPFAEDDFAKAQDPFDTDFVGDFKLFNKQELRPINKTDSASTTSADHSDKFKFPSLQTDKLQPLFPSPLSKSPNRSSVFEKQMSLSSVSPRNSSSLSKQNTFDVKFDSDKSFSKLGQLHENPSLDMSSESESAPEPPPRPATNITPIKPPPLPPKKQPGDIAVKPPPRPPHNEESHYDYMESYETGLNSLDGFDSLEQTPPLPVPARKSRFDSDFSLAPQRPKKQFQSQSSDDDYLTPIAPPLLPPQKKDSFRNMSKDSRPILLPPPMKKESSKRTERSNQNQVTVASYLESKPKITSTTATDKLNLTSDTLDITLSQLTLSGLNELANKLNIPPSQLSNMTLVQLTSYLSNYVKTNSTAAPVSTTETSNNDATFPTFKADFSANFNDFNNTTAKTEPYDRYAVFRELLQQEELNKSDETVAQDKEETSKTEDPIEETPQVEEQESEEKKENMEFKPTFEESSSADKYAALREIIIADTVITEIKESNLETMEEVNETEEEDKENDEEKQQNDLNQECLKIKDESDINDKLNREVESNIIEYENSLEPKKEKHKSPTPTKSPTLIKSPIPIAITEIIQTSNHLTSGSVSDVVSGSSPEIDNVGSTSETVTKKNVENTTRESWAIFDTPNHRRDTNKEKQVQSEEGVSPWSSDSKEFGNGSPSEWQQTRDSGSEGDWARRRRDRDGTWWDTQGEMGGHYEKPSRVTYTRDRRSTDSYDDEWYEPDRPRRRTRQQASHTWNKPGGGGGSGGGGGAGGQSSSSRDVSPWEEEEPRGRRDREECWPPTRRSRGPSWDRERHRQREDSWDEEDDYEYEEKYVPKFQWTERHGSRESDRGSRDSDRHSGHSGTRDPDHWDSGGDQWTEERRHVRRRIAHPQDERWCRPEWDDADMERGTKEKMRYGRWPNQECKWRGDRERKRETDRYYKRDHSQESPWEDDYSNDPDEPHSPRYLTARRNWKRPASASEMDRKSGEIKSRQPYYMGTGGSDGERDRKYRSNRRSRSRDSQFSEMSHQRHKPETSLTLGRYSHRNRNKIYGQKFDNDFSSSDMSKGKLDVKLDPSKKSATLGRKKVKELSSPKIENESLPGKSARKQHLMFENDFVNSETDSPVVPKTKFNFENEFETSEAESPVTRYSKSPRSHSETEHFPMKRSLRPAGKSAAFENDFSKDHSKSGRLQEREKSPSMKQKSLFEDDFSPTDKVNQSVEDNGITVIAEESVSEPRVSFTENNLDRSTPNEVRKQTKHILTKNRIANNIRGDGHIKKSESVNIFARENDPFDDDFFSGRDSVEIQKVENTKISPVNVTEFKWTEDFDSFDIPEENK